MQSLSPHAAAATPRTPADLTAELTRLEAQLAESRARLVALQDEFRDFKLRYTQIVGAPLAELAEVEAEIRGAEARAFGLDPLAEDDEEPAAPTATPAPQPVTGALRKLFWSVARLFHPDHAADEAEARRRHAVMAEASRAYREGDVESLHTLLGDKDLQFYCASHAAETEDDDLPARLVAVKEELRTVEFGIKRIEQDGLYRIKLLADEEARHGRDALTAKAAEIRRQIVKARRRLVHLGG